MTFRGNYLVMPGRYAVNNNAYVFLALLLEQVAQLSQRDCATAAWVKFGQKWKSILLQTL